MTRFRTHLALLVSALTLLLSVAPIVSTPAAAAAQGDVRITLKTCDGNATPFSNINACQSVVEDDGMERVQLPPNVFLPLADDSRDAYGSYYLRGLTAGVNWYLQGFEPIRRDNVYVTGATQTPDAFVFQPEAGVTLDITLYYFDGAYSGPAADGQVHYVGGRAPSNAMSNVRVTMKTCPRGVNPNANSSRCTDVVGGDGMEYLLNLDTGKKYYLTQQGQDSYGTYVFTNLPDGTYEPRGFNPIKTDRVAASGVTSSGLIWVSGGYADVTFYYYYNN